SVIISCPTRVRSLVIHDLSRLRCSTSLAPLCRLLRHRGRFMTINPPRSGEERKGMRPISAKTAAACAASVVMLISLLGLAGTARAQVVTCVGIEERVATIVGTEGDDVIVGTSGDDVIQALGGNDQVDGGDGNDLICG